MNTTAIKTAAGTMSTTKKAAFATIGVAGISGLILAASVMPASASENDQSASANSSVSDTLNDNTSRIGLGDFGLQGIDGLGVDDTLSGNQAPISIAPQVGDISTGDVSTGDASVGDVGSGNETATGNDVSAPVQAPIASGNEVTAPVGSGNSSDISSDVSDVVDSTVDSLDGTVEGTVGDVNLNSVLGD